MFVKPAHAWFELSLLHSKLQCYIITSLTHVIAFDAPNLLASSLRIFTCLHCGLCITCMLHAPIVSMFLHMRHMHRFMPNVPPNTNFTWKCVFFPRHNWFPNHLSCEAVTCAQKLCFVHVCFSSCIRMR